MPMMTTSRPPCVRSFRACAAVLRLDDIAARQHARAHAQRHDKLSLLSIGLPDPARMARPAKVLARHITMLWMRMVASQMRRGTRLVLESLDDRTLNDIGLRRCDIGPAVRQLQWRMSSKCLDL